MRQVAAWTSGEGWTSALIADVGTAEGDADRRRVDVSVEKYLAIAIVDRDTADYATGRSLTTSNATAAARATALLGKNVSERVAERARRLMILRGFAVVLRTGSYMTRAEQAAARAAHGGHQIRAASVRALTVPRGDQSALSTGDLPASPQDAGRVPVPEMVKTTHVNNGTYVSEVTKSASKETSVIKTKTKRASARAKAAPRPPAGMTRGSRRRRREAPRSIATIKLAAKLQQRMPWLCREEHQGRLCDMLDACLDTSRYARRVVIDGRPMLVIDDRDVTDRVEARLLELGLPFASIDAQRDPIAYLAWGIRQAIKPEQETRMERHEREQIEGAERARQAYAEVARDAAARAADDTPERRAFFEQERQLRADAERRKASDRAARLAASDEHRPVPVPSPEDTDWVTVALLGEGRHPVEFAMPIQDLHARVVNLVRALTGRGWALDVEAAKAAGDVAVVWPDTGARVEFVAPSALPADAIWRAGDSAGDLVNDVAVYDLVACIEQTSSGR